MNIGTNAPSKTRIVMVNPLIRVELRNHRLSPLATSRIEAGRRTRNITPIPYSPSPKIPLGACARTSANRGKPQAPRIIAVVDESLAVRSSSFHFGAILPSICLHVCLM